LANWIIPKSQPCNSIVMFDFFPTAGHMNNQTLLACYLQTQFIHNRSGKMVPFSRYRALRDWSSFSNIYRDITWSNASL
jgi:hypothetical protein